MEFNRKDTAFCHNAVCAVTDYNTMRCGHVFANVRVFIRSLVLTLREELCAYTVKKTYRQSAEDF
jgi:hypothetical protein